MYIETFQDYGKNIDTIANVSILCGSPLCMVTGTLVICHNLEILSSSPLVDL